MMCFLVEPPMMTLKTTWTSGMNVVDVELNFMNILVLRGSNMPSGLVTMMHSNQNSTIS